MGGSDAIGAEGILAAAELWAEEAGDPMLLAGWEDLWPGCAKRAAADGADACRRCATGPVRDVLRSGLPAHRTCPNGTRLLAFPAPAGSRLTVALLRLGRDGASDGVDGRAVLAAARRLRSTLGLTRWQAQQRARGEERLRTAVATLERVVATTEEFHRLYTTADRDRASTAQDASNLDSLARETLREAEDVRTQIAHELHDTAAQSMVSAHRFLEAARASLAGPDAAAAGRAAAGRAAAGRAAADRHLDAADERLLIAIREVRGVLNSLVPPGLEELGLANALRIYVRDAVPTTIHLEIAGDLPRAEGWLEAGLFAMTTGAIDNAVIHARPTLVEIALRADGRTGIISVRDDGVGFDAAQARRRTGTGMGLLQMARRAGWLGGRLDVTSRPDEGTTVRMTVPLGEPPGTGVAGR
jgi:signal transduction histidine kinase